MVELLYDLGGEWLLVNKSVTFLVSLFHAEIAPIWNFGGSPQLSIDFDLNLLYDSDVAGLFDFGRVFQQTVFYETE
jgi:hypothetical protein